MTDLEIWWLAYLAALSAGLRPPCQTAGKALDDYRKKESELEEEDDYL